MKNILPHLRIAATAARYERCAPAKWLYAASVAMFVCGCGAGPYPRVRDWEPRICGPEESAGLANTFHFDDFLREIEAYNAKHGHLPSVNGGNGAGGDGYSWRYELLRSDLLNFVSKEDLSPADHDVVSRVIAASEPWNSPDVSTALESLQITPAKRGSPFFQHQFQSPPCYVLAVSGAGTAFEVGKTIPMDSLDGDTILFVESASMNRVWWQPQETALIDRLDELLGAPDGISSDHPFGFLVGFKDGVIWRISRSVPAEDLRKFMHIESAKSHEREVDLRNWKYDLGAVIAGKMTESSQRRESDSR